MTEYNISPLIKVLGSLILDVLVFSIPVLLGLSIGFHWYASFTILMVLGTAFEFVLFLIFLYYRVKEEK